MGGTGIVRHPLYIEHLEGVPHVESPARLKTVYRMLDSPDMAGRFEAVEPRPATDEEITRVHTPRHVERIRSTTGYPHAALDPDTQTTPQSSDAAHLAAGGLIELAERVWSGELQNGFALVRPPGHHAESERAMGFCLFNNVAVAAAHLLAAKGADRIMIVDWDLHHGNATQHSFESESSVLYASTHQYPYYPGSGSLDEVGRDQAKGCTINVPLSTGHGDAEFYAIFRDVFLPIGRQYKPDFILVSAGFDTYHQDPLGGMQVSHEGYAAMTRLMMALADEVCGGKLVYTLEGGYDLEGLRGGVQAVLLELVGDSVLDDGYVSSLEQADPPRVIDKVLKLQSKYWEV
ncbi:MAG: histone deacetylase [Proteobacteria bacterium]|nr:histone deacetylase [Pseudomonadota bacterium]